MNENSVLPNREDVARALLARGSMFVHLDPRVDGVDVPPWLRDQPQLVLQVGLDMPIPIPDLQVDDKGMYGTLSFNRSPYPCRVSWDAIFALVGDDGRGMVWPQSIPNEIADEIRREIGKAKGGATPPRIVGAEKTSLHRERAKKTKELGVKQTRTPSTRHLRPTEKRGLAHTTSVRTGKSAGARKLPPYLKVIK